MPGPAYLYLLRHGPALPHGTPGIEDDARPLTGKGRRKVRALAQGLERLAIVPDRILTSPLPRASQTALLVAEALEREDALESAPELDVRATAESVRAWLASRTETRLMLVGHDPWISDLVGLLATGRPCPGLVQLRKGGLACLVRRPGGDDGYGLDLLVRPRLLRLAGE